MTIQERIKELIQAGAAISIHFPDDPRPLTMLLAGAAWLQNPPRLRWCAVFPEHDGHIHESEYEEARLEASGRDIAFYAEGKLFLYVCPYEESGKDLRAYRDTLAEWRDLLSRYDNARKFEEMINTPRG
jgi:hypothetical protein